MPKENNYPFVSIIIPCRNEEAFIEKCLFSILKNDYPLSRLEILVVDGMSEDSTRSIAADIIKTHPVVKLLDNPKKITPSALNIGIKASKGDVIMRMDAHSIYKSNYISSCVKYLKKYNADNVGGIFAATPPSDTFVARAISLALSHPFGVGNSYFRIYPKKSKEADTVAFGCYKRSVFDKIGLFNENLARSQDMEFNMRLKNAGGRIILFPDIIAYYYTDGTLGALVKHNFKDGIWAVYPFKFTGTMLKLRHTIPLLFIISLLALLILSLFSRPIFIIFLSLAMLYAGIALVSSLQIALRKRDIRYIFLMPVVFAIRHFIYGIGSLSGLFKLALQR